MKLFGSSKKSKHAGAHAQPVQKPESGEKAGEENGPKKSGWKKRLLIALASVAALVVAVAVGVVIFYKFEVKPPSVIGNLNTLPGQTDPSGPEDPLNPDDTQPGGPNTPDATGPVSGSTGPGDETQSPGQSIRPDGVYTVVVAAKDMVGSNTDAIMVAKFDTRDYSLKVVSIPRDTLVNVKYSSKLANAMYAYGGTDGFVRGITNLVGFQPDFYVVIKLNAIQKLIDEVGGVDFYVPQNMDYDDDAQNLHIHFKKGMTHMTGAKAVEYMRFRKGYADQDIGRIHAQQEFLTEMIRQVLAKKDKISVTRLVDIFFNDVKTSLSTGECAWFAKELLKMNMENISFDTMPGNYNDSVKGRGYVTVKLDEWLKMINETINPFNVPVTAANLDVLYRNSAKKLVSSSGVFADANWAKGIN